MLDHGLCTASSRRILCGDPLRQAQERYGRKSAETDAVRAGWDAVKVPVHAAASPRS